MKRPTTPQPLDAAPTPFSDLIDEHELARRIGIGPPTLRKYRHDGKSPPYIKIGKHVRYDWAAVCAWLDGKRRLSTAPTPEEQRARQLRNKRKGA